MPQVKRMLYSKPIQCATSVKISAIQWGKNIYYQRQTTFHELWKHSGYRHASAVEKSRM